jgi:pyridine nucleotide-disulfide oxidoreductase family protein
MFVVFIIVMSSKPVLSKLVLIGGGHSHSVALLNWLGQSPIFPDRPIADITLVTPNPQTISSGSVPGHLAGWWNREACEVNVADLAGDLGIKIVFDEAIGLDLAQKCVICQNHDPIAFDTLSLDIGSTPQIPAMVSQRIIPMKPMGLLLNSLEPYLKFGLSETLPETTLSMAIVGGGLGGVEVALSLKERLGNQLDLSLICRSQTIAPSQSKAIQNLLANELESRSIRVYLNTEVNSVQENTNSVNLILNSGECSSNLSCDGSLWATQATSPQWIADSGLRTDDRGFVLVDRTLRSVSHSNIFASGDIATIQNMPQPKAGVLAVRQGKIIGHNLRRSLANQSLKVFNPQSRYLNLVSLGDRRAVASYGEFSITAKPIQPLLWHWKKTIDDGFVSGLNFR